MKLETTGKAGNRRISIVIEVLLALMLGCACFYVFVSMFGLKWSQNSMFSGGISEGFAGIWDKVADKLGSLDYIMLPKFKAELKDSGEPVYGLALTLILIAFTVISYLIIKAKSRALLLLFAVPLGTAMLFYGLTPSAYAGGAFACAIIIVLAVMTMPDELAPKFFIVPIIMLLIGTGVLAAVEQTITLREPRTLAKVGASVKGAVSELRYGSDPLPQGDLSRLDGSKLTKSRGNIKTVKEVLGQTGSSASGFSYGVGDDSEEDVWDPFGTDDGYEEEDTETTDDQQDSSDSGANNAADSKTALEVNMTTPESYYLRGFIGATYDKSKWSALDNDTFYDMRDTVFWMNRRGFDGLSEMSRAAELGGTSRSLGIMPGAASDDTDTSDAVFGSDDSSDSSDGNDMEIKVKSASRRLAFTPYELKLSPATGDKLRASEMVLPKGTRNYGGSHLGNNGLFGQSTYKYKAAENITGSWTNAVGKLYTAPQSEDIQSYFISESHYNVLQYENYKKVPDEFKELFSMEVGSPGDISDEHAEYKETISLISGYLSSRYLYSESFKKPGKRDSIEAFIERKSGCDVHFASLATLLFRYYGIPARYVEGYLITPHMLENSGDDETPADSTVNVPKAANHAWTEIYIDGFGWVPFEATPEYRGVMDEADLSIGLQNVDYEYTPPENDEEEEDDDIEEEDEEVTRARKKVVRVMRIVLLLLLLAVLIFILRKVLKKVMAEMKWRQAFKDKDPKTAVRALYQYSVNHGWKLSDRAESLGLAAAYSKAAIQESDRKMMQSEFDSAKTRYKQERAKAKAAAKEARAKEKAAAKEARAKEKAAAKEARAKEKAAAKEAKAKEKAAAKEAKATVKEKAEAEEARHE